MRHFFKPNKKSPCKNKFNHMKLPFWWAQLYFRPAWVSELNLSLNSYTAMRKFLYFSVRIYLNKCNNKSCTEGCYKD